MTLLTVLPVFAADVVMEAPDILLTGVGFDVNVAGLDPQSTAELRLNGEVIATSSDGSIAVFDIVLSDTGTANFDVTQGGHSVIAQALTIIPGWISLSAAGDRNPAGVSVAIGDSRSICWVVCRRLGSEWHDLGWRCFRIL